MFHERLIIALWAFVLCYASACPIKNDVSKQNIGFYTSSHWTRRASAFLDGPLREAALKRASESSKSSRKGSPTSGKIPSLPPTSDILREAGRHNVASNCIYRVEYKSLQKKFVADHGNATHCVSLAGPARNIFFLRTEAFLSVLTFLLDSGRFDAVGFDPSTDFEFYIDTTDATPVDYDLFVALGRPVLSQSHSPLSGDKYTLPYPDHHQVLGMAAAAGYHVPPELKEASAFLAERYTGFDAIGDRPWKEKKDTVVFRALCVPTFRGASRADGHVDVLPVRGEICQSVQTTKNGNFDFDVGVALSEGEQGSLADMCRPCSDVASLNWKQMASKWRYIVNADGYGMSYDGTFWKLAANSTVFWVMSGSVDSKDAQQANSTYNEKLMHQLHDGPLWQAWYSALLHPGCHFVPVKVNGMKQALDWCRNNEETCMEIAGRGAHVARTLVTPEAMLQHLTHTLLSVQRWQRETLAAWRESERRIQSKII